MPSPSTRIHGPAFAPERKPTGFAGRAFFAGKTDCPSGVLKIFTDPRIGTVASNDSIEAGDAFIFGPGEAHQLSNDSSQDIILYVVADNPVGESCHYPDSGKWLVRSPEHRLIRSDELEYYDGEE